MIILNAYQPLLRFRGDLVAERMSDAGIVNDARVFFAFFSRFSRFFSRLRQSPDSILAGYYKALGS